MNYTDEQLKKALAKMLPEKIEVKQIGENLYWKFNFDDEISSTEIRDTELPHLCWLMEETLTTSEIEDKSEIDLYWWEIYRNCDACEWLVCHASWQQRVIALAKVKGIKI